MNLDSINWDEDLPPASSEEEYQALRRAIQRTDGFGLLFVQCAPAKGHEIIKQIKEDLPQKKVEVLSLKEPIRNLYERVEALTNRDEIDVLFVEGLEYSIYEYEDAKRHLGWTTEEIQSYSWKGVPHILTNLNQQRERFRDNFSICFVFLVPLFILKYLIHRAPDFFDWRSGVFQFWMDVNRLQIANQCVYVQENSEEKPSNLNHKERWSRILEIQSFLEEDLTSKGKANLLFEQAFLLGQEGEAEASISGYDRAIDLKPNFYEAWFNRASALTDLGRYKEAVLNYNYLLKVNPDEQITWFNRGYALGSLGRYEEEIENYDRALELKPNSLEAWNNRGYALCQLNRYKEAIISYEHAFNIAQDLKFLIMKGQCWLNLEVYDEAVQIFESVLRQEPHNLVADMQLRLAKILSKGEANGEDLIEYMRLSTSPEVVHAIQISLNSSHNTSQYLDQAKKLMMACGMSPGDIELQLREYLNDPEKSFLELELVNLMIQAYDNHQQQNYEEEFLCYEQILKTKPDRYEIWTMRGIALRNLKRDKEALNSFKRALELQPDYHKAWFQQGCSLFMLSRYKDSIDSYEKSIEICSSINDKENEAKYLTALSQAYSTIGQTLRAFTAANQANQLLIELGAPTEEMPYPNWLKRIIQFSETSKFHGILAFGGAIILAPFLVAFLCVVIPWRILRFRLLKKGDSDSKPEFPKAQ